MNNIKEIKRLASPAQLPQSLAWDGSRLWMGSLATSRVYQLKPDDLSVQWETAAPGRPFGMTWTGEELRVLCGETEEDHRLIRRCLPGSGFDEEFAIACPDDTGSQLGWDGKNLHVSQWYRKQVLVLDSEGSAKRVIPSPHEICGQVIVDGILYLVTTDDESTNEYYLTRIDPKEDPADARDIARIPFPARALAFDGQRFWTNHRAAHQIVAFEAP